MSGNGNRQWGYLLLIASLSAIIVATIYPFTFEVPEGFSILHIANEFNFGSAVKDYLQNILLFMPLGIALALIFRGRSRSVFYIAFFCFIVSTILSTSVEITQLFLSIRTPNLSDIICNALGGTLGGILYCRGESVTKLMVGIVTADTRKLSISSLLMTIASYCLLIILGVWVLLINVNLSNWNDEFYLAVGNEVTGDRPWNGYVHNLSIGDRSLKPSTIAQAFQQGNLEQLPSTVADFDFIQLQPDYGDSSQHLPNLTWQSTSPLSQSDRNSEYSGILVNSERWLKTTEPVSFLTERLKQTDEFTLFLTIATNKLKQIGPARILSLSGGVHYQNLVVAQRNTSLNFRLRTPITGNNPTQPEFIIPEVFADTAVHSVAITFADDRLNFYVDSIDNKHSFTFTPATCFAIYFPWEKRPWFINFGNFDLGKHQRNFYTIIIFPLAILVSILIYFIAVNKLTARRPNN